jgi:hypothetical protein
MRIYTLRITVNYNHTACSLNVKYSKTMTSYIIASAHNPQFDTYQLPATANTARQRDRSAPHTGTYHYSDRPIRSTYVWEGQKSSMLALKV